MSAGPILPLFANGNPPCCICDPVTCEADETGSHCQERSCGVCLYGCPSVDETQCCQAAPVEQ